ncbi:MAG: TerC family protein [Candidatus Zixiibacteriota bacterium]|nr:MAG: TerC family protein [candidate division Zixibacteria bacterium]
MISIDLGLFHRKAHAVKTKEALIWCAVWISLALLFNAGVYHYKGGQAGIEFLTGYLIELSLSLDNLFVFLLIFSFFRVPKNHQHSVLYWGILGALVMRAIMIASGIALINEFHWIIYVFGAFLVFTGVKMFFTGDQEIHPEKNIVIRLAKKLFPVTHEFHEGRFFIRRNARLMATPLFLVLLVIETTDLVFAVDSIPAILAITRDSFIVYTSNVFAILGLRSFYFALAGMFDKFRFLKVGLAIVLTYVGLKMLLADIYKIPTILSLAFIALTIGLSILISFLKPEKAE